MLKIKLARVGKRSQPSYRIIVAEARSKRNGQYTDLLCSYNPLSDPPAATLDLTKYQNWLQKGAQPTPTVKNIYTKAAK
jgi:small subunit ribosomal protein S16